MSDNPFLSKIMNAPVPQMVDPYQSMRSMMQAPTEKPNIMKFMHDYNNKTTYIYVEHIENKENTGWIISNSSDYSSRYNYSDADYEFYLNNYVDLSSVLEVNDDTQSADIAKEKEESKESDKRNIDSILENKLLLCVILAVIIFVVAIIIIVLVNKNKKNKVNKEETSKE